MKGIQNSHHFIGIVVFVHSEENNINPAGYLFRKSFVLCSPLRNNTNGKTLLELILKFWANTDSKILKKQFMPKSNNI